VRADPCAEQTKPFSGIDAVREPILDAITFGADRQPLATFGGGYIFVSKISG